MLKNVVYGFASAALLSVWNGSALANPPAHPTEHAEDHGDADHHDGKDHHAEKPGDHHDGKHADHHDGKEASQPKH